MASQGQAAPERRDWRDSIIVALGGNLAAGEAAQRQVLEAALEALSARGLQVVRRSGLWRSAAWPDPSQPPFLNAVAWIDTPLDPAQVLAALHGVEAAFGRTRTHANGPRTLDLDLIAYGRRVCAGALVLPHPRAGERLFVMGPLAEIAPDWRHPLNGKRAVDLALSATVGLDATPLAHDLGHLQWGAGSLI